MARTPFCSKVLLGEVEMFLSIAIVPLPSREGVRGSVARIDPGSFLGIIHLTEFLIHTIFMML
jgi:hypothetical protein